MCRCDPTNSGNGNCGCTYTKSAAGSCDKHGMWLGPLGCPGCAYELAIASGSIEHVQPHEASIPEGYKLVSENHLERFEHLVDELVSLLIEMSPPDVPLH